MARVVIGYTVIDVVEKGCDMIIEVNTVEPYHAYIRAIRIMEHGVYHYHVVVRVEKVESYSIYYGFHKTKHTTIEYVFYGERGEQVFNALLKNIKKVIP